MNNSQVQDQLEDFFGDADMEVIDMSIIEEEAPSQLPPVEQFQPVNVGIDFSALGSIPGVVVGDTGIEVQRTAVPRLRFKENSKDLISIVGEQVIVVKTHYDEAVGSNFICFGGDCCKAGLPRVRYVYPCVKYTTDDNGKPVTKDLSFGALCVGYDVYDQIQKIKDTYGSISGTDILVTCSSEKFQKLHIEASGACRWSRLPGKMEEVSKFWSENMKDITKAVARQITPEEYAKLKKVEEPIGNVEVDFADVFGE